MIAIEIGLVIAGAGLCAAVATMLAMRRRYRRQEWAWDARLRMAHATITAAQRETAVAIASMMSPIEPLSDRERDVLTLLVQGLSNKDIADKLFITEGTVKKSRLQNPRQIAGQQPHPSG